LRKRPASSADVLITAPMRYMRGIVASAERNGIDRATALSWGRIDAGELDSARARVSLNQFSRMFHKLVAALDDEMLGLVGAPMHRGSLETVLRAASTGSTLRQSAAMIAVGLNATLHVIRVKLDEDDEGFQLVLEERQALVGDPAFAIEMLVLTCYALLCWLVGQRVPLAATDYPFPTPRHLFELRMLLPGRLRFGRPKAALCMPMSAASMPVRRSAADISQCIRRAPGVLVEGLLVSVRVSARTRELLKEALPGHLSMDDVAKTLAMSPRTLHRKLHDEGETFQSINDSLRKDLATELLRRTQTPIKQLASDLGFSDQAAFQRAFVRWTGCPPAAYRDGGSRTAARMSASPPAT
jgi:AraC-like DNA-binding protein